MVAIAVVAALSAVLACSEAMSTRGAQKPGKPKFALSTMNSMSVGANPDVAKVFKSVPSVGCTGFILDGKACAPDNDVNAQVAKDPTGESWH
jgi:hypothetical protein